MGQGSPGRRRTARVILDHVAKSNTFWDRQNFAPDDPFSIVMAVPSYLESTEIEVIDLYETMLGRTPSDWEVSSLLKMNLGEVVEFFLVRRELYHMQGV